MFISWSGPTNSLVMDSSGCNSIPERTSRYHKTFNGGIMVTAFSHVIIVICQFLWYTVTNLIQGAINNLVKSLCVSDHYFDSGFLFCSWGVLGYRFDRWFLNVPCCTVSHIWSHGAFLPWKIWEVGHIRMLLVALQNNILFGFIWTILIWCMHLCVTMLAFQTLGTFATQITKFMAPTWGPRGSCRPQMGPVLAPWTLLSGYLHTLIMENRGYRGEQGVRNQQNRCVSLTCWIQFIPNVTRLIY